MINKIIHKNTKSLTIIYGLGKSFATRFPRLRSESASPSIIIVTTVEYGNLTQDRRLNSVYMVLDIDDFVKFINESDEVIQEVKKYVNKQFKSTRGSNVSYIRRK